MAVEIFGIDIAGAYEPYEHGSREGVVEGLHEVAHHIPSHLIEFVVAYGLLAELSHLVLYLFDYGCGVLRAALGAYLYAALVEPA